MKDLFPMVTTLFLIPLCLFAEGESDSMPSDKIGLPDKIDGWKLKGQPRTINQTNIFDYMNGAGELYLSYHLHQLLVYDYRDKDDNDIKVELYRMSGSNDAFGLLSLDWGGEPVELNDPGDGGDGIKIVPTSRALYGKGLLRAWSDDLYIRIMAYRDTPENKKTILALAKTITYGRDNPPPPQLLCIIESPTDSPWKAKANKTAYFYSHLVLNSLFYLSHENILNLGLYTEAMLVFFEREEKDGLRETIPLLVIKYPDHKQASKALMDFHNAYLPEVSRELKLKKGWKNKDFFKIEDGWLGYRLVGQYLVIGFACPDTGSASEVLSRAFLK